MKVDLQRHVKKEAQASPKLSVFLEYPKMLYYGWYGSREEKTAIAYGQEDYERLKAEGWRDNRWVKEPEAPPQESTQRRSHIGGCFGGND